MRHKLFVLTSSLLIFFIRFSPAYAIVDPLTSSNNPYGIHILNEADLEDAANLVNSSGGDWGYVTLVMRKDERDTKRWQAVFDKMRRLHLIPLVRIATIQQGENWEKPNFDEIDGWVSFLNSLNWVVQNRYIIIGNEPNHAKEWGGEVNPNEYAIYLETFSKKLKVASVDFFILPAGFDSSAPNSKESMNEKDYLLKMTEFKPNIFNAIDGWTSHSYPNPGFSGSEEDEGRGTITTYKWELYYLEKLGLEKKLPFFITETGWAHNMDGKENGFIEVDALAQKMKFAFKEVWNDPRIVAVTPFVLNYQETPFDVFSWKRKDGTFYNFYYSLMNISKNQGKPKQKTSGEIVALILPPIFPEKGKLTGIALVQNTGQTIWTGNERIQNDGKILNLKYEFEPKVLFSDIEPAEVAISLVKIEIK